MTVLRAIVLGVVQGVTEFLPISSKTHLVAVPALLGWDAPGLAFIVWLHLGTLVALVAYFFRYLLGLAAGLARARSEERRVVGLLAVASVPAAVVGVLFEKSFERLLGHPKAAAIALLATAAILLVAEWVAGTLGGLRRLPRPLHARPGWRDAVTMGVAQCAAFLPGVSRSGSTMGAGLVGGLSRATAAEFSFLMAIAAIAGANLIEFPKLAQNGIGGPEVAGFVASLASGYAAIALLLRYLRRRSFLPFAVYCAAFAALGAFRL